MLANIMEGLKKFRLSICKDKFFALIVVGIFFVPLSSSFKLEGTDVWYVQYLALLIVFMVGVAIYLWETNRWLSLLSLCATYSALITSHQNPVRAIFCLVQFNLSLILISVVSRFNQKQRKGLFIAIFGLFLIQVDMNILQYFNLDMIFNSTANEKIDSVVGYSGSSNQIGLFWAVTGPLALYFNPNLIILNIIGLFWSTTTIAWIAFVISCLGYIFFVNKKTFVAVFALIAGGSGLFFTHYDVQNKENYIERYNLAKYSIRDLYRGYAILDNGQDKQVIKCNSWTGFGLGNFIRISPHTQREFLIKGSPDGAGGEPQHVYEHMHNDIGEAWYEMGHIGFAIVICTVIDFFMTFFRTNKTKILMVSFWAIVAHLISSTGIYTVQTAVSGLMLIIFYGIFLGEVKDVRTNPIVAHWTT